MSRMMKYCEIELSKNCSVRIYERNKQNIIYQGKNKKMPESVLRYVQGKSVLSYENQGGVHVIILGVGKPLSTLQKEKEEVKKAAKHTKTMALTYAAFLSGIGPYTMGY